MSREREEEEEVNFFSFVDGSDKIENRFLENGAKFCEGEKGISSLFSGKGVESLGRVGLKDVLLSRTGPREWEIFFSSSEKIVKRFCEGGKTAETEGGLSLIKAEGEVSLLVITKI